MKETRLSSRYVAALDGLRALAITAVIFHGGWPPTDSGGLAARLYVVLARGGWAGVQLFFVLSGFLITGILLDARESPHFLRNFYARRALRIFPAYYLLLVVALWVAPLFLSTTSAGVQRILHAQTWLWTYTTNVAILIHNGWMFSSGWLSLDHTWSLAVEEQFYLVWPLLVLLLPRRGLGAVAWIAVVGGPLLRWAMLKAGTSPEVIYSFTPCRLDALAMGSLLSIFVRSGARISRQRVVTKGLMGAGLAVIGPIVWLTRGFDQENFAVQTVGFTGLAILCAGTVLGSVSGTGRLVMLLGSPPARFVGRYSYGMYLCQGLVAPIFRGLPVGYLATRTGVAVAYFLVFALRLVVSTAIAFASWHVFERRFLAYKDRFTR